MSDDSYKTFSVRLSPEEHTALDVLARRLQRDRSKALRWLIRQSMPVVSSRGVFTTFGSTSFKIRLRDTRYER